MAQGARGVAVCSLTLRAWTCQTLCRFKIKKHVSFGFLIISQFMDCVFFWTPQTEREERAASCTGQHTTWTDSGLGPGLALVRTRSDRTYTASQAWVLFKEEDQKKEETLHTDEQLASRRGHNQREESKYCSPRAVQQGVTVCVWERRCLHVRVHVCVWVWVCACVHAFGGLTPGGRAGIGCCGGESYVRGGRDSVYVVELTEHRGAPSHRSLKRTASLESAHYLHLQDRDKTAALS